MITCKKCKIMLDNEQDFRTPFCWNFKQNGDLLMSQRLDNIIDILTNNTVLAQWFSPMQTALEKVRFSDKKFRTLSMSSFILLNCERQLQSMGTLREHIQHLFHLDDSATESALARSTASDALSSRMRAGILAEATERLANAAAQVLPDRLSGVDGIGDRPIYAMDCTYQEESSHYYPVTPKQGGQDNSKGHLQLATFDLRHGIPLNTDICTHSVSEIRFIKEYWSASSFTEQKNAIFVVDRAFIDAYYWDIRNKNYGITTITRMKSNLNYEVIKDFKIKKSSRKQGIVLDQKIKLDSSSQDWRLIGYYADSGEYYEYLTNEFNLKPGIIAFLYHRRWDEEKYFDNYKNDLANSKAWGKSPTAIQQQAMIGMVTFILTKMFCHLHTQHFGLPDGGSSQNNKHKIKQEEFIDGITKDMWKAFHTKLSKVTKQVWRFLKECMCKNHCQSLYDRQFRPILIGYM